MRSTQTIKRRERLLEILNKFEFEVTGFDGYITTLENSRFPSLEAEVGTDWYCFYAYDLNISFHKRNFEKMDTFERTVIHGVAMAVEKYQEAYVTRQVQLKKKRKKKKK